MNTIVKYSNRKYYFVNEKKYINLDRIVKVPSVKVIDYETKYDITQETLLRGKHKQEMMDLLRSQM